MDGPKIVLFDIETTRLEADAGFMLIGAYKVLGEKRVHVYRIDDYENFDKDVTDDSSLVADFAEALATADVWVTHYGPFFDIPFIQSRLLTAGFDPLPPTPNVDTWRVAKSKLRLQSNRLENISQFLRTDARKTYFDKKVWMQAAAGNSKAIDYIAQRCIADVNVLEETYLQLRPLMTNHPNVGLVKQMKDGKYRCPSCGSTHVQKRGTGFARSRTFQRFQCQSCGSWGKGKFEVPPGENIIR